jgi:hypothetical protein
VWDGLLHETSTRGIYRSIELMLKELGELDEVIEILAKPKTICQFIYNNAWVLNLMRKKTEGTYIFQPVMTVCDKKFNTR